MNYPALAQNARTGPSLVSSEARSRGKDGPSATVAASVPKAGGDSPAYWPAGRRRYDVRSFEPKGSQDDKM